MPRWWWLWSGCSNKSKKRFRYNSTYVMVTLKCLWGFDLACKRRNNRATALGSTPGLSAVPMMVCVLPQPVAPDAKIVAFLLPDATQSTKGTTLLNTSSCFETAPSTWS